MQLNKSYKEGIATLDVYGIPDLDLFGDLFHEINENCKIQNIPATTASSEFAAGQYEINLRHSGDLLKAADDAALLRRVIKETCSRHGYEATFMAKPFLEETGNGMHLHISVYDNNEKNIFTTTSRYGNDYLKNAIAGLQSTFYDSFPIFIPGTNFSTPRIFAASSVSQTGSIPDSFADVAVIGP